MFMELEAEVVDTHYRKLALKKEQFKLAQRIERRVQAGERP